MPPTGDSSARHDDDVTHRDDHQWPGRVFTRTTARRLQQEQRAQPDERGTRHQRAGVAVGAARDELGLVVTGFGPDPPGQHVGDHPDAAGDRECGRRDTQPKGVDAQVPADPAAHAAEDALASAAHQAATTRDRGIRRRIAWFGVDGVS